MSRALAAGLALLAGQAAIAQAPTLTAREAGSMSTAQLAARVLGMAGTGMAEVRIHSGPQMFDSDRLRAIEFAGRPSSGGWPGLCEAAVTQVRFVPSGQGVLGTDPPSMATGPTTGARWSILPDSGARSSDDALQWMEADQARCAALDPALAREGGSTRFFDAYFISQRELTSQEMSFVVDLLRRVDASGGLPPGRFACGGSDAEFCKARKAAVTSLGVLRPARINVEACEGEARTLLCVEANYGPIPGSAPTGEYQELTIRTDAPNFWATDCKITGVELTKRGWIV